MIVNKKMTTAHLDFIRANYPSMTKAEIARSLNVAHTTVADWILEYGIEQRNPLEVIAVIQGDACYIPIQSKSYTGHWAVVDRDDFHKVIEYPWSLCHTSDKRNVKVRARINKKWVYMHSIVLSSSKKINHKDKDHLNNRRENLREVDGSEMCSTRDCNRAMNIKKTSRFKGVSWSTHPECWRVVCQFKGVRREKRCYSSEEDAAMIYDRIALSLQGEFAQLNFPHLIEEYRHQNKPDVSERAVRAAFIKSGNRRKRESYQMTWEHGQWRVTELGTGRTWSVVETDNGLGFEIMTEGNGGGFAP